MAPSPERERSPLAAVRRFLTVEPYRRLTDDELWARFRDHADGDALRVFLERVGGRLWSRGRAVTADAALADDALQDALVQLVRHRRRLATHNQAVAWLYRVTDSRARMLLRTRRRARKRDVAAARPEPVVDRPPTEFERVAAAVADLPARERQCVELVYLEGMTHEETAAALGLGRGAVGTYVGRGVKRLRERLGPGGMAGALIAGGLAPERAAALALTALVRGTSRSGLPLLVAAGLVAAGGVGWVAIRDTPPPEVAVAPPPAAPESLPARTLRLFRADVLPRQLAALAGQAANGGEVRLASVDAFDGRLECWYELAHRHADGRPFFTTRMLLRYRPTTAATQVVWDRFGTGRLAPLDPERFLILWTDDPVTKKEITAASNPLKAALAAFAVLPADDAARRAEADAFARVEAFGRRLAGDWRGGRAEWGEVRGLTGLHLTVGRAEALTDHQWLRLDEAGRLHGLEPGFAGPLTVSADGRRLTVGEHTLTRE